MDTTTDMWVGTCEEEQNTIDNWSAYSRDDLPKHIYSGKLTSHDDEWERCIALEMKYLRP